MGIQSPIINRDRAGTMRVKFWIRDLTTHERCLNERKVRISSEAVSEFLSKPGVLWQTVFFAIYISVNK